MINSEKAYLNWSSGKDSALSLYRTSKDTKFSVEKLITTISSEYRRVSMHGLREELLQKQAKSIGIPLEVIELPEMSSMSTYDCTMNQLMERLEIAGFRKAIFGDIFLEDLRRYRESKFKTTSIQPVFPLWKEDSRKLMNEFIELGFKAIVVCTNSTYLDDSFCGRVLDNSFVEDLPGNVDPCGENGEFHTFVYDGPIFKYPVSFDIGQKVRKTYQPSGNDDDCFEDDDKGWDTEFCYLDLHA